MDEQIFLTLEQCAQYFNVSKRAIRNILEQYGIKPVYFGRGRNNGFRWHRQAVFNLANDLYQKAQDKAKKIASKKITRSRPISGKSFKEIYSELSGAI